MSSSVPAAFTGSRVSSFRYDLLDVTDQVIGSIDGVEGGSLNWSAATSVKAGGTLSISDVDGIDWLHARVRIWRTVNGIEWSRGVYVPSVPREQWVDGHRSFQVELLGKLSLLDNDPTQGWTSAPAGVVVTDFIRTLLVSSGYTALSITDSDATLRTAVAWEPGTSLLAIVNDLLNTIGYWSMTTDGGGRFVAEPYVRPADRAPRYEILDGAKSIYEDVFTRERDVYGIPNRVVLVGEANEDTPALVGVAENIDPSNEYSIPARGMVVPYTESNVEAASQTVIDDLARRALIERTAATSTVEVPIAPLPLDLNDALLFRSRSANIFARHTVQAIRETLDPTEMLSVTLREVVDL